MSSGYASRLSEYSNKGICGLPEVKDSQRAFTVKLKRLAELVQNAPHIVVITGAGVSTSAGIPDFRGPYGVWTKEKESKEGGYKNNSGRKRGRQGETAPRQIEDFSDAKPTLCHRAITKLVSLGKVDYCVTQNVDGLHRRSGLSRSKHAAVHGCVFTERCENKECGAEFFRDFDGKRLVSATELIMFSTLLTPIC